MLLAMLLLGAVYAGVIAALVSLGTGIVAVVVVAAGVAVVQLFASDKLALAAVGAKELSSSEQPKLHAMIERLCVQADIAKPRIALVVTDMPNAFALGRSRRAATVCVTTGLLRRLKPAELEAVLAHELSHVINRDMMVMTIASFLASVAALLARLALRYGMRGHALNQLLAAVFTVLCSIAVYLVSFVLLQTLSRYREYAADRGAAIITGRPSALSSALLKLTDTMKRIPDRDLRTATQLNAFFIVPPSAKRTIAGLFASHPPVEKRIAALGRLEAQLQRSK